MFWIVYIYLYIFALDLKSFSDIFMTFFPSSCVYFNNFFMFTLSSAAGPSTSSSSDDTLPKETDSPKCFKEKRKRPRSELTDFFLERNQKNRIRNLSCSWIKWKMQEKKLELFREIYWIKEGLNILTCFC